MTGAFLIYLCLYRIHTDQDRELIGRGFTEMGITKTDFMRGMQCPRMMWLDRHKPQYRIIPPETQARLDAGNEFGDKVMGMFGPYEEMTVFRPGTNIPDKKKMAQKTRLHLLLGTPVICEAAFIYYNNYCAADILKRTEDSTGYDFYEVKNAAELKDQFIRDAAFQYYIMNRCKAKIQRIFIVLHGPDEDYPCLFKEITGEAKDLAPWVDDHIWDLNNIRKQKEEPDIMPGDHCTCPYECWYRAYCDRQGLQDTQIRMEIS